MHRHVWKVVKEEHKAAPIERLRTLGLERVTNVSEDVLTPSTLITYRCEKCGSEKVERV